MISIVTAYFNRKKLLIRTLESLKDAYGKVNFEMIVVDDGSKEDERLDDLLSIYPFLKVCRIEPNEKWYSNPCIPFNKGFELAKGDKIILQNPECYHFHNILEYVDQNLKQNEYLSFGCFSLDKESTDSASLVFDRNKIDNLIKSNPNTVTVDGGLGWYNHSKYRPASFHFCTAMMAEDLVDLGGFDPRFALGHGFDDDDLIFRIRLKGMKVIFVDDKIVLHQNHYVKQLSIDQQKVKYINEKAERNKLILETITQRSKTHRANYLSINGLKPKKDFALSDLLRKIKSKLRNK
ncbi:glycosyltransferase family 2 protein [Polluticaenibacter yanchengensis]|uniref:Glycosyltransferase family 2 protein n=1 Tax=Polluticaenibacter yanchengensis TaxID=3014562 RepID=A0ABT4UNK0_9BACT|nr:glycosyltransferase family 2 protein [Chitinophagaceae bacterium LY-5]